MKKLFFVFFFAFCGEIIAAPYLTNRQENIINAIVDAEYDKIKQGSSILFDTGNMDIKKITPKIIEEQRNTLISIGKNGLDTIDPSYSSQTLWIFFAAIATSYNSPDWVCAQYDSQCKEFAKNDNFPDLALEAQRLTMMALCPKNSEKCAINYDQFAEILDKKQAEIDTHYNEKQLNEKFEQQLKSIGFPENAFKFSP
ncbi:hypothetical protein [Neisseria sp. Ec49-e6-T10]|uniref:hypothetical protein n=1 Tax=Neisseria sp. Ec49-e6-T10 TaxID=3140744 RepID=UPI003EBFE1F3